MMAKQWNPWTTGELKILREIWASERPLKTNIGRLSRHTLSAILFRAHREGLPRRLSVKAEYSPAFAVIKQALLKAPDNALGLSEKAGVSYRRAHEFCRLMHEAGQIHITGWRKNYRNGPPSPIWAWGEGDDVKRPKPIALGHRIARKKSAAPFDQIISYSEQMHREAA
ncbi:hypothetical protein [Burkholderia sp. B21-007]|uniref:hypothetical protein n=1 Tax=Burkholderia sp. B21-007 TaxID=2890407 RepID=UPI001E5F5208|nr:hypothetical protein [Burkholderia sp. B21-007]UEP31595.1 hypothetical protein LMA01_20520 [Burkholderia sp. B21-007]